MSLLYGLKCWHPQETVFLLFFFKGWARDGGEKGKNVVIPSTALCLQPGLILSACTCSAYVLVVFIQSCCASQPQMPSSRFVVKIVCNWNDPWSHKISSRLESEVTRKKWCYVGVSAVASTPRAEYNVFRGRLSQMETSTPAVWVSAIGQEKKNPQKNFWLQKETQEKNEKQQMMHTLTKSFYKWFLRLKK